MLLTLSPLLDRFAERTPLPVMARALLERSYQAEQLDAWFSETAESQYTRELLFSTVFALMSQVVFRHQSSVHAAYQHAVEPIGVSLSAVYDKLKGIEPHTSAALVAYSAVQAQELIEQLGGEQRSLLAGVRVKIIDGNCLSGREHRLKETRTRREAPLPGKSLAVLDPALGLITQLVPCEDAYTQERALVDAIVASVQAGECWLADRNFCTLKLIHGIAERGAWSVIREHGQLSFVPLEKFGKRQRIDGGWASEQRIRVGEKDQALELRRVRVELDEPTRDGDHELYLWSTLPKTMASAKTLAEFYQSRWCVETAFLKLTVELRCEIKTLGYPRAALFGFAVAVVVYNALAVVWAALRVGLGDKVVDEQLSTYHMASEMANVAESLTTVIDAQEWTIFQQISVAVMASWLLSCIDHIQLRKYQKAKRGPKKPPPKRLRGQSPHLSIARELSQRKL
jgi:hypothetical protein